MDRYRINRGQAATQFLYATVRVELQYSDGSRGAGTAFFFDDSASRPVLVTNCHVLEDAQLASFRFHISPSPELSNFTIFDDYTLTLANPASAWTSHPDTPIDLG